MFHPVLVITRNNLGKLRPNDGATTPALWTQSSVLSQSELCVLSTFSLLGSTSAMNDGFIHEMVGVGDADVKESVEVRQSLREIICRASSRFLNCS